MFHTARPSLLLCAAFAFAVTACEPGSTTSTETPQSAAQVVTVSVQPPSAETSPGGAVTFSAIAYGTSDLRVVWFTPDPADGDVDAAGRYIAPHAPGIYRVYARSLADPSVTATATVTVTDTPTQPTPT